MKPKLRRELIEWGVILSVALTLYTTGLHTDVIGTVQRGVLTTGIITPSLNEKDLGKANYNLELESLFRGESFNLSEYKGEKVFVNFWASWCTPCIAEMPDIQALYNEVGENVKFVMISLDKDPAKARRFMEKRGFTFPTYTPTSNIPDTYTVSNIPATYVLSPSGDIAVEKIGMAKYNTNRFKNLLEGLE